MAHLRNPTAWYLFHSSFASPGASLFGYMTPLFLLSLLQIGGLSAISPLAPSPKPISLRSQRLFLLITNPSNATFPADNWRREGGREWDRFPLSSPLSFSAPLWSLLLADDITTTHQLRTGEAPLGVIRTMGNIIYNDQLSLTLGRGNSTAPFCKILPKNRATTQH